MKWIPAEPKKPEAIHIDVHVTSDPGTIERLCRIENMLNAVINKEIKLMALGQEILDAVAAESTVVDSVVALIQQLIANQTVTPEQGQAILAAIAADKAKLEAALVANTPAQP